MKYFTTATVLSLSAMSHTIPGRAVRSRQANGEATVDLSKTTGEATFLASGFIYGWPDNAAEAEDSIPDYLVRDIKFNSNRAGGAQTGARGWGRDGYEGYRVRLDSALSNYWTTRKYGGDFILLIHDLWGADGGGTAGSPHPGDNGSWTHTEEFLRQLAADLTANDMLEDLVLDIWNEPDLELFWDRSWEQFLEYYVYAHKLLRELLPDTTISGPSKAYSPKLGDEKWTSWLKKVAESDAVPDIYSWHQIGDWEREPDTTVPDFDDLRAKYGLPDHPFDINEYASKDEQNPANTVYYIGQLERHNMRGLRANWGSGPALHDYMASLIYSADGTYYPNGEWVLYKYYAEMVGERLVTTASPDRRFDVFATKKNNAVKILAGTRSVVAPYNILVSGLSSLGLPEKGELEVQRYSFEWKSPEGEVHSPVDLGSTTLAYSWDTVSLKG
jgi:hypothetical protein